MAAIILHFIPMTSENSLLFSFVIHMRQTQLARDLRLKIGHDIELTFRIVILGSVAPPCGNLTWCRKCVLLRPDYLSVFVGQKNWRVPQIYMRVSENGGTPSHHPFYFRISHEINHPAIGVAPWLWKPPYTALF